MLSEQTPWRCRLPSEAATLALGRRLGELAAPLERGLVIYLRGELGAGKTTLARGFLRAFAHDGHVKSPTYTLVEPYELPTRNIYHFDLYRIGSAGEVSFLGVEDYFLAPNICLIEWPERGGDVIPQGDVEVCLHTVGTAREAAVVGPAVAPVAGGGAADAVAGGATMDTGSPAAREFGSGTPAVGSGGDGKAASAEPVPADGVEWLSLGARRAWSSTASAEPVPADGIESLGTLRLR